MKENIRRTHRSYYSEGAVKIVFDHLLGEPKEYGVLIHKGKGEWTMIKSFNDFAVGLNWWDRFILMLKEHEAPKGEPVKVMI